MNGRLQGEKRAVTNKKQTHLSEFRRHCGTPINYFYYSNVYIYKDMCLTLQMERMRRTHLSNVLFYIFLSLLRCYVPKRAP